MKINKKGFAVSSMLYGLIFTTVAIFYLIIAVVSNRYETNINFVDSVRNELSGSSYVLATYSYTGEVETFIVPKDGIYRLEVWGASGGSLIETGTSILDNYQGGKGGYSSGNITLTKNTELYIVVGEAGSGTFDTGKTFPNTYNGGGGVNGSTSVNHITASGGGATHIAITTNRGELKNYENYKSEILIVAGGGGGARDQANHVAAARWGNGGAGGGLQGIGASSSNGSLTNFTVMSTFAGTQSSGFAFGQGGTGSLQSGGGGGYYGGYSGNTNDTLYPGSGSGGSGYLSTRLINPKSSIAGNLEVPTHDGKGMMTGNEGHGYAKITFISSN